jgi:hypothetical protein
MPSAFSFLISSVRARERAIGSHITDDLSQLLEEKATIINIMNIAKTLISR